MIKIETYSMDDGWEFIVMIDDSTTHKVKLTKEYYHKLTHSQHSPEKLVKESILFLLDREPKEAILEQFELQIIQKYFSEYEDEIKTQLHG